MTKKDDNRDFFLKEKPVDALVLIHEIDGETFCGEVSDIIDSTYAHTVKIVSKMDDLGLLDIRKDGRKKMLSLSKKGEGQAIALIRLLELYERESKGGKERSEENTRTKLGEKSIFS